MIYTFYRGELTEDGVTRKVDAMYWEEMGMNMVALFPPGYFNTEEVRQRMAEKQMKGNHVFSYSPLRDNPGLRLGAFMGHVENVWKTPSEASWKVDAAELEKQALSQWKPTFDPKEEELKELRERVQFLQNDNEHLEKANVRLHSMLHEWKKENETLKSNLENTHKYADEVTMENRKLRKSIDNATLKLSELFSG